MRKQKNQRQAGMSIILIFGVIAIVAVIVIAGWFIYSKNTDDTDQPNQSTSQPANDSTLSTEAQIDQEVPTPQNVDDLRTLQTELDSMDAGDESFSELDEQTNF